MSTADVVQWSRERNSITCSLGRIELQPIGFYPLSYVVSIETDAAEAITLASYV